MKEFYESSNMIFDCYRTDFEMVKVCKDLRQNCFFLYAGSSPPTVHYLSSESENQAKCFEKAWFRANFDSVLKHKVNSLNS